MISQRELLQLLTRHQAFGPSPRVLHQEWQKTQTKPGPEICQGVHIMNLGCRLSMSNHFLEHLHGMEARARICWREKLHVCGVGNNFVGRHTSDQEGAKIVYSSTWVSAFLWPKWSDQANVALSSIALETLVRRLWQWQIIT